mmetsp:Transcript_19572/g.59204  ORF Transcript_19572/g.59204 Transcript_19572/m.59204 type:complete len:672 (+) Transcript_19572:109-2124(+)|eukprot:CAMPEP_0206145006 /NCGR_PEP_ID=MMETSP1473-20131121/26085_1 /ASSEMBLY_ACC=CAM_ASM_001109 /TAXON_ID=1461547 /ORGANISM="Stichococcus sp, Strain RCC1054" /LENGTH=671 /DNA_ID=CAMNT_0053541055 /DNA_START=69 /DNA_END=2084 /DNA_ORIENTATION=-
MAENGGGIRLHFLNITLGNRGGASVGKLDIDPQGLIWRKTGGGRKVELFRKDIEALEWTRIPKGGALSVKKNGSPTSVFVGFRDQDLDSLKEVVSANFGHELKVSSMSAKGRNWGDAVLDNETLQFHTDGRALFNVALPDVVQVQHGKDEVMLEFLPDTGAAEREDALCEMTFYVPRDNERYAGADEETPPSKMFLDAVNQFTSDGGDESTEPIATFDSVAVLAPRGRFTIELYNSFLKLAGPNQDYRIQYEAVQRIFILPKPNSPHTLVVAALDPPIRKGQTHYQHVLAHFPTDEEFTVNLAMTGEQLAAKNEKHRGKLHEEMSGASWEVFGKTLRGLSGAKLTRPSQFRSQDDAYAVRCSYKADDGYLYPLEKAFFYVHKPPLLLLHEDIESVEFCRQGGGGGASTKTFDLAIRDRNEQEFLFRGIQKQEWDNLFQFISVKGLPIANLAEAQQGPGGAARLMDLDLDGADIDSGKARMDADSSDEEDEDFDLGGAEAAQQAADEEASDSDDDSDEEEELKLKSKPKKRPADDGGGGGGGTPKKAKAAVKAPKEKKEKPVKLTKAGKPKKERAKKDKNAPKRGMSAFMFFSNAKRAQVKEGNPGIAFGEVGRKLGELWKAATAEEKATFEEQAAADKERATREMAAYKAKGEAGGVDDGGEAAGDDQESD